MKPIIEPVAKNILVSELSSDKFIRETNNGDNLIYIITHHDSPNVMKEIARLREHTFRTAGGGTGLHINNLSFGIISKRKLLEVIVT